MDALLGHLAAVLLVSLRIAPTLAFAPPFTYLRTPVVVRVILSFGMSAWLIAGSPDAVPDQMSLDIHLILLALPELLLGIALALSLQLAFAAILTVGRTIDFQVGFGLAVLADPTTRAQLPLVGALFAYATAAIFFSTGGLYDLLAIWKSSLATYPIGHFEVPQTLAGLLNYVSAVFAMAMGLGGLVLAAIFLVDVTVAFLSRTLPQMNVLVLGFQVKSLVLLLTLPFVFAISGSLFFRLLRLALVSTDTRF